MREAATVERRGIGRPGLVCLEDGKGVPARADCQVTRKRVGVGTRSSFLGSHLRCREFLLRRVILCRSGGVVCEEELPMGGRTQTCVHDESTAGVTWNHKR